MSGATYLALIHEGDRWLDLATDTYRGGGAVAAAHTEATIAGAYFLRALLEKPDLLAAAMGARARQQQQPEPPVGVVAGGPADPEVDAAMARHPAGNKRRGPRQPAPPQPEGEPA